MTIIDRTQFEQYTQHLEAMVTATRDRNEKRLIRNVIEFARTGRPLSWLDMQKADLVDRSGVGSTVPGGATHMMLYEYCMRLHRMHMFDIDYEKCGDKLLPGCEPVDDGP